MGDENTKPDKKRPMRRIADRDKAIKERTAKNKALFIKAYIAGRGIVSAAAKKTKLSRANHYTWLEDDPEYVKAIQEADEVVIDGVEQLLHDSAEMLNASSIQFFLKSKAAKRGYANKVEVSGKDGGPVAVTAIFNNDLLKENNDGT